MTHDRLEIVIIDNIIIYNNDYLQYYSIFFNLCAIHINTISGYIYNTAPPWMGSTLCLHSCTQRISLDVPKTVLFYGTTKSSPLLLDSFSSFPVYNKMLYMVKF